MSQSRAATGAAPPARSGETPRHRQVKAVIDKSSRCMMLEGGCCMVTKTAVRLLACKTHRQVNNHSWKPFKRAHQQCGAVASRCRKSSLVGRRQELRVCGQRRTDQVQQNTCPLPSDKADADTTTRQNIYSVLLAYSNTMFLYRSLLYAKEALQSSPTSQNMLLLSHSLEGTKVKSV
jgi:hypothetical protein